MSDSSCKLPPPQSPAVHLATQSCSSVSIPSGSPKLETAMVKLGETVP